VPGARQHSIFIATTREAENGSFGSKRSHVVAHGRIDMSVPPGHQIGRIERASRGLPNPEKDFASTGYASYTDPALFSAAVSADTKARGGRVLVFVHGYHNTFDAAVYRATQLVADSGYAGTPILFSWPSAGRTLDYVYDNNSATASRTALEETLRLVAKSGATRVDIIGHSMGAWVTMEALRQLAIAGDRDLGGKLGDVVLASPDIDVDVFKSQMRRYGEPKNPFFVMVSRDDRALALSRFIAGDRSRVGDFAEDAELASLGVNVMDVTGSQSGDAFNHARFADNPVLVQLLGQRLNDPGGLNSDAQLRGQLASISQGLGEAAGSAVKLIITTPFEVLNVATGGS
jgi:esterase/lipase superfamily enzyme